MEWESGIADECFGFKDERINYACNTPHLLRRFTPLPPKADRQEGNNLNLLRTGCLKSPEYTEFITELNSAQAL